MGNHCKGNGVPTAAVLSFFMNRLHRDYSSCDEFGQPELLVLSDEVTGHLAGQSRSPSSMSAYRETGILWGLMTTGLATMSNFDVAVTTRRTIGSWGARSWGARKVWWSSPRASAFHAIEALLDIPPLTKFIFTFPRQERVVVS